MSFLNSLISWDKGILHRFKNHTRWKSYRINRRYHLVFVIFILFPFFLICKIVASPSKLVLYQGLKRSEISSKRCAAGIYVKNFTTYTCACVTGVWGFYNNYCEKPISIAAGDNYCFRLKNQSLTQVVTFGNPLHPFEASINIFHKDYYKMTDFYTDDNDTLSDPTSSFLTITDTSWTIYGDKGEALCLKAVTSGKRKFCLFRRELDKFRSPSIKNPTRKWKSITKVKKGCLTKNVQRADSCSDILPPNDFSDCGLDVEEDATEAPEEGDGRGIDPLDPIIDVESTTPVPFDNLTTTEVVPPGWIKIKPKKYTTAKPTDNSSVPHGWIKIKPKKYTTPKSEIIDSTTTESNGGVNESDSTEIWIPIYKPTKSPRRTTPKPTTPTTTTEEPPELLTTSTEGPKDFCKSELSRESVKDYWIDPDTNMCSKSINEAVFTDQLRRFTVKQFDKVFESRLKSLTQMEQLLNYTKLIMQKTCIEDYVPTEFFQVAFNAFMMFIREDFFYGAEGAIVEVYPRILKALRECVDNVKPYVFETDPLECGIRKINGVLILPSKLQKLEVPARHSYKDFEPLIETVWKMFLNTHSICFSDFQFSNDHHHFSVLIMELFSKSIYEKWIEPLDSQELYSFILPNYHFLKETQENIDFCVAAADYISTCPAWMSRSGVPPAKSRKKRGIWVDEAAQAKRNSEVWNGEAFCLNKMNDPELRFGLPKCI